MLGSVAGPVPKADAQALRVVTVQAANQTPTRTGVTVQSGQRVQFVASGSWCMGGRPPTAECGSPAGIRAANIVELPLILNSAPLGALIGRVGNGPWFIARLDEPINVPNAGEIFLVFNDRPCCYGDNSGAVSVTVNPLLPNSSVMSDEEMRQALTLAVGGVCAGLILAGLSTFPYGVVLAYTSQECSETLSGGLSQLLSISVNCFERKPPSPLCRNLIPRLGR